MPHFAQKYRNHILARVMSLSFILVLFPHMLEYACRHESEVAQSCPILCTPMDCSLPGSSVHGIFQAILFEWIAIYNVLQCCLTAVVG